MEINAFNPSSIFNVLRINIIATNIISGITYAKITALFACPNPMLILTSCPMDKFLSFGAGIVMIFSCISDMLHAPLMLHDAHALLDKIFTSMLLSSILVIIPSCEILFSIFNDDLFHAKINIWSKLIVGVRIFFMELLIFFMERKNSRTTL